MSEIRKKRVAEVHHIRSQLKGEIDFLVFQKNGIIRAAPIANRRRKRK